MSYTDTRRLSQLYIYLNFNLIYPDKIKIPNISYKLKYILIFYVWTILFWFTII